jgi:hypothetical protein
MKPFLEPVVETGPRPDPADREQTRYLRSYLVMRAAVGALGVALPVLLVAVDGWGFGGEPFPRDSLSAYYYSGVRDLFVGVLFATAVFLITYKCFERNLDNTLSIVAGLAVLAVALFPTATPKHVDRLTPLQDELGEGVVKAIHFTGAGVFILSLAVLCYFFGVREGKRPPRPGRHSPRFWRTYHWTCAGVIVAAVAFIAVTGLVGGLSEALLLGEWVSIWAFGASWLAKGLELDILRGRPVT